MKKFFIQHKGIILYITKLFLFLRVSSLFFAAIGVKILPFKESFPYAPGVLFPFGSPLFWSWANFDGVHYIRIVEDGYIYGLTQAYFPFYPVLIKVLSYVCRNLLFNGLLISHLAFLASLFLLYKLCLLDFKKEVAKQTLLLTCIFPTAFFFLSYYTESLFLALILASFYLARQKKWLGAGILGALASATRVLGILTLPALLFEYFEVKGEKKKINYGQLSACFLPAIGLGAYMLYLKKRLGDAFLFVSSQPGFGAGRSVNKVVLLYQVFWRYLKMIVTVDRTNPIYFTLLLEVGVSFLILVLLIWSYKKIRNSYLVFAVLAYLLPTLTGTFSSMPRYVLILFPAFFMMSLLLKDKKLRLAAYLLSFILSGVCTIMFTRGYWVA